MQRILLPQSKREDCFHGPAGRATGRTLQSADRKASPCTCLKRQIYAAYADDKEAEGTVYKEADSRFIVKKQEKEKGRRAAKKKEETAAQGRDTMREKRIGRY